MCFVLITFKLQFSASSGFVAEIPNQRTKKQQIVKGKDVLDT